MAKYCDHCTEDLSHTDEFENSGSCTLCVSRDPAVRGQVRQARGGQEQLLTEWLHGDRTVATISATRLSAGKLTAFIELCELAVATVLKGRFASTDGNVGSMRASIRMMKQALGDLRSIENVSSFLAERAAA